MPLLKMAQIFAVAKAALKTEGGLDIDDLSAVMVSPPFTVAMYLNKYCELIYETQDYSRDNQTEKAAFVIRDAIKHRWKKHLKSLKKYCKDSFICYCLDELQNSKNIIKTLSDCLLVMSVFENILCYSSLDANDPIVAARDDFVQNLQGESSIKELFNIVPKFVRGDDLISVTFDYYKKMCDYSYSDFSDKIFANIS